MEHTVDEIREIIGSDSEMAKKINSMPTIYSWKI